MSRTARGAIESTENELLLSDGSLWEIAIKQSIGKLQLAGPFPQRLIAALRHNAIALLPLDRSHLWGVAELPFHHRDPFDRLLVSTARIEGLAIVTDDTMIARYGVEVIA